MTSDLQHAVANMQTIAVPAATMADHLSQLEDAITTLMKVYDKLKMWLIACQKHESKQKPRGQETQAKIRDKQHSSKALLEPDEGNRDESMDRNNETADDSDGNCDGYRCR